MPPSPVVITLRGWKEKQAICPWGFPIGSHCTIDPDLASRGASGIFDQGKVMATCHRHERMQVARHSHLVNCENGTSATGYSFVHMLRIKIVGR